MLDEWSAHQHPEGNVYYSKEVLEFRVVAEMLLLRPNVQELIEHWTQHVVALIQSTETKIPNTAELFLNATSMEQCLYYFVDHATKTIFWLEDVDTCEILREAYVESETHLRKYFLWTACLIR